MGRGWVSVLVGLTLVLSGCSGSTSDQPKVLPPVVTPSASPSVASTASPVPVVVPSAAAAATPQGAAAFVRFFFDEVNGAFQDGRSERIRVLADASCATCNNFANAVRAAEKTDSRIVGTSFASLEVESEPPKGGLAHVTVAGTIPARQSKDRGVVSTLPALGRFIYSVEIQRNGDGWLIREIRIEKS